LWWKFRIVNHHSRTHTYLPIKITMSITGHEKTKRAHSRFGLMHLSTPLDTRITPWNVMYELGLVNNDVRFECLIKAKLSPGAWLHSEQNSHTFSRYSDWLRAGRPRGRSSSPGRVKNFLFSTLSRPVLGFTRPPIQWVSGALLKGIKRPGRECDHSPPTSAEVKKMWIYISTPPYAFMA
jgi:hypothetical protein